MLNSNPMMVLGDGAFGQYQVMKVKPSYGINTLIKGISQVVLVVKNPPANAGDKRNAGSIPGSGRSPVRGRDNPLQISCLEDPLDRAAWWAVLHRVTQSWA